MARYVIEVVALGSGGSLPGVTAGGTPWDTGAGDVTITGGPGVVLPSAADSPARALAGAQPIYLGTFGPQRISGKSSGYLLVDVPLGFLFEPVAKPLHLPGGVQAILNPKFKPSALIHLQAQEPPPDWPDTGPKGSGLTCINGRSWGIGDAAEAYRGEGVPIIYHEDYSPLTPGSCPAPQVAAAKAQTDQELGDGRARLNALLAEAARTAKVIRRLDDEWGSVQKMDADYYDAMHLYIHNLPLWWHAESLGSPLSTETRVRSRRRSSPRHFGSRCTRSCSEN